MIWSVVTEREQPLSRSRDEEPVPPDPDQPVPGDATEATGKAMTDEDAGADE